MKKHEKTIRINYLLMHLLREILTGSKYVDTNPKVS